MSAPKAGEAAAVWTEPSKLLPWAQNPRRNEATVPEVIRSIRALALSVARKRGEVPPAVKGQPDPELTPEQLMGGWGAPLLVRQDNGEIIAGHSRVKAAIKLKLPLIPVRYVDADEAGAHDHALRDNKASESSEWDAALLGELAGTGIDLTDVGFGLREIEDFGKAKRPDGRGGAGAALTGKGPSPNRKLIVELLIACQDAERIEKALNAAMDRGAANRGASLLMIANAYLGAVDVG